MIDGLIISESKNYERFYPFSPLHPIWEIRIGTKKIYEKYLNKFSNSSVYYTGREKVIRSFEARKQFINMLNADSQNGKTLLVTSNYSPSKAFFESVELYSKQNIDVIFYFQKRKVAILKNNSNLGEIDERSFFEDLNFENNEDVLNIELDSGAFIENIWDAIYLNERALNEDFYNFSYNLNNEKKEHLGVFLLNKDSIYLGNNVIIHPNVVLNAENGPIIVEDNVKIMSNTTIVGPCYIGKNSIVKIGSKIYENSSIGEFCKIGGEIENSIFQGYSNKQHDGFLGHSFISEWVNLGADTNTSDLKNTYSEITLRIKKEEIKTGKMFLGLLCGDHTKTAISTKFTTGTVAGICGILVREGFLPNFIPSFSWGGAKDSPIYKYSKAIEIAKIVMARRKVELTDQECALIIDEHNDSSLLF